jgi:hypothetical protein
MAMNFDERLDTFLRAVSFDLVVPGRRRACKLRTLGERTQRAVLSWDFSDGFKGALGQIFAPDARIR